MGARQRCAFDVAFRELHSVLQDEAVRLQISLLQQADPVFFPWTYCAYGQGVPKGCWHTIGVTLGELFPSPGRESALLLLLSGVEEE